MQKLSDSSSTSLVARALDTVDRGHARTAARLHEARNRVVAQLERGLDRAEELSAGLLRRARHGLKRADAASADAVNRAQGVVGQAIERARLARSAPALAS
jgi:hypothetical protein